MNSRIASSLAACALVATAAAASAQTTVAPNADPAKVGVTQPTAIDVENKAAPRSDTGTLVRTGKARRTAADASAADGSMTPGATGATTMGSATANASTENAIDKAAPTAAGKRARHGRS